MHNALKIQRNIIISILQLGHRNIDNSLKLCIKTWQNVKLKLDILTPPLASVVPLLTNFWISMMSCVDCDVRLHCLQTRNQDPAWQKHKYINYVCVYVWCRVWKNDLLCQAASTNWKFPGHWLIYLEKSFNTIEATILIFLCYILFFKLWKSKEE